MLKKQVSLVEGYRQDVKYTDLQRRRGEQWEGGGEARNMGER